MLRYIVVFALLLPAPRDAAACTTFGFARHRVVGKSYDWHTSAGLLMVNPRGQRKAAALMGASSVAAARWRARYGSVTFNQYGRGFPNGGINERGLVVEIMWLSQARYGSARAGQRAVNELAFIQYLLDEAASVDDAIRLARTLHVARGYARVHYMTCDRSGACATLEHIGGKLVVHSGAKLPTTVLTNHTYRRSLRFLGSLGGRAAPGGSGSLARFARAARRVRAESRTRRRGAVARAFALLDAVRTPGWTRWQIVYESASRRVSFRLPGQRPFVVALSKVDFRCGAAAKVIDLTGAVNGRAGVWQKERAGDNAKLVRLTLGRLKLPAAIIGAVGAYPRSLSCR